MKILVTGFEPFNGRDINPSQLILEKIEAPENVVLVKKLLPVEFKATTKLLQELLAKETPDIVISLGQAGNRPEIAVERVAINLDNVRSSAGKSELPDNAGDKPVDQVIEKNGEAAYFSTLPVWEIVDAIQKEGIPAVASYSAGTYVCNHVMYTVLHESKKNQPQMKAGFIHVPFLPEQNPQTGYVMELEEMVKAVQTAIHMMK